MGSSGSARRYSRNRHFLRNFSFFSSGYLDVSVHRVPPAQLWIHCTVAGCSPAGFPHSDICGSLPVCGSPQLFAAYHVFLRPLSAKASALCPFLLNHGISMPAFSRLAWRYSGFLCFLSLFLSRCVLVPHFLCLPARFFVSSSVVLSIFYRLKISGCFCFYILCSGFSSIRFSRYRFWRLPASGLKWTRTTDLTLIRRAL